jgi:hypothetical protein
MISNSKIFIHQQKCANTLKIETEIKPNLYIPAQPIGANSSLSNFRTITFFSALNGGNLWKPVVAVAAIVMFVFLNRLWLHQSQSIGWAI